MIFERGFYMAFYKKIIIKWSYPIAFDRILEKESVTDMGIYYISRQFGDKKSILYIGKTNLSIAIKC